LSKIIRLEKLDYSMFRDTGTTAVIGFFDGVHTGHKKIIKLCVDKAKSMGMASLVFTFDKPPLNIIKGKLDKKLITSYCDRIDLIKKIGVDYIVVAKFNTEFAELEPGQFCRDILKARLNAREVFIGRGFKFGKNSAGDADFLKSFFRGKKPAVNINVIDIYKIGQVPVSSTTIRKLYSEGNIEKITEFLGRFPSIKGKVVKGDQRGRIIGFPTANIDVFEKYITLKDGVYAGYISICTKTVPVCRSSAATGVNGSFKMPSVVNIGNNPTFKGNRKWIESHILDFDADIYGQKIEVVFLKRLRDEISFESKEELIKQIKSDIAFAEKYFMEAKK
jgi:riboflavin kinase / FMN adenylyltransferase